MILFRITAYDSIHIVCSPYQENLNEMEFGSLVMAMREAPAQEWINREGVRGWLMPINQPTVQFIEDRWVEDTDYTIANMAKQLFSSEKIISTIQKGRATKRWEYIFNGERSDFVVPLPDNYDAMDHQNVAVETMLDMPYFGLLMEMGTGKTLCICAELDCYFRRLGDYDSFRALIVVPKSLRGNWKKELIKFTSDAHDMHIEMLDSAVKGGQALVDLMQSECRIKIGIISYDSVRSLLEHLKLFLPNYMVLDESHYVKSPSTKRFKHLIELADTVSATGGMKRILTGTPVSNKIVDLWSQFEILKRGVLGATTYKGFARQYAVLENHGDWTVMTGYKNVERLKQLMAANSFVIRKDQCLDLPDKMYETRYVEMSPEHRRIYNEYNATMATEVDGRKIETKVLIAQLTKLSQMCSGFVNIPEEEEGTFTLDGASIFNIATKSKTKTVAIPGGDNKRKEMLDEAETVVREGKLIIWCTFHYDLDAIEFELRMRGIPAVRFDGRCSEKEREIAVEQFNNNDKVRVFIGQQRAGGVGLTLLGNTSNYYHSCRTVFYYSNSYSYMDRSQSEDRAHRIGQTNKVLYIDWVCENTIDEAIAACLLDKKDLADMVKDVESVKNLLLGGEA